VQRLDLLVSDGHRPDPSEWRALAGAIGRRAFPALREVVVRGNTPYYRLADGTNPLDLLGGGDDALRLYNVWFNHRSIVGNEWAADNRPRASIRLPLRGLTTLCLDNARVINGEFAPPADGEADALRCVGLYADGYRDRPWPTAALRAIHVTYQPGMFHRHPTVYFGDRVHSLSIGTDAAYLTAMAKEIRLPQRGRPLVRLRLDLGSVKRCEDGTRNQKLRSVVGRFAAAGWIGDATEICVRLGMRNGFAGVPAGYWLDAVAALPVGRPRAVLVWDFERGAGFRQRTRLLRCQADGIADNARACLALDLPVDVLIRTDRPEAFLPADELRRAVTGRSAMPERERNLIARGDRCRVACELRDEKMTDHPGDVDREMQWYT
jgi:hypothetical protein